MAKECKMLCQGFFHLYIHAQILFNATPPRSKINLFQKKWCHFLPKDALAELQIFQFPPVQPLIKNWKALYSPCCLFGWLDGRSVGCHINDSTEVTLVFEGGKGIPSYSRENTDDTDDTDDTNDTPYPLDL